MNVKAALLGLAWDVGLPVAAFYLLSFLGASDWAALLMATCLAGVRLVWGIATERALNPFATVMLIVFGLGLVLSFATGDARFLLVVKSLVSGAIGLVFLGTAVRGRRPLTLAAQQSWSPATADDLAAEYAANPAVRRGHLVSSTVWGLGLLTESLLRVPIVYLLPLDVAVGASSALLVVTLVGLVFWNARYAARAEAAGA
ncbi:MAG: hypothetical protein H0X35_03155 [Pseudonocardiales bacterium]|nr:hypothetical protein [Pseudonocardiales bacterium]